MNLASLNLSPVALLFFTLSLPARSTRYRVALSVTDDRSLNVASSMNSDDCLGLFDAILL